MLTYFLQRFYCASLNIPRLDFYLDTVNIPANKMDTGVTMCTTFCGDASDGDVDDDNGAEKQKYKKFDYGNSGECLADAPPHVTENSKYDYSGIRVT